MQITKKEQVPGEKKNGKMKSKRNDIFSQINTRAPTETHVGARWRGVRQIRRHPTVRGGYPAERHTANRYSLVAIYFAVEGRGVATWKSKFQTSGSVVALLLQNVCLASVFPHKFPIKERAVRIERNEQQQQHRRGTELRKY